MLINLSSKKNSEWDEKQKTLSISTYESIVDIEFPIYLAGTNENEIKSIISDIIEKCKIYFNNADLNNAIAIIGDSYFTFIFVTEMLARGYKCIHPTYQIINNELKFIRYIEYKRQ
jgi:hypothetical protein